MSVEVILKYTPGTCLRQNFVERNNEARLINQKNIRIKYKKKPVYVVQYLLYSIFASIITYCKHFINWKPKLMKVFTLSNYWILMKK